MKETILIVILITMLFSINSVNKRIDRLIEVSTPEYINVVPDKVIIGE